MPKRAPSGEQLLPLTPVVLHILLALATGDDDLPSEEGRHGYAVAQEVESLTGGTIRMGPGTLYGSIQRMLAAELIEEVTRPRATRSREVAERSGDDPRRRYYRATALGRSVLELELRRLACVVEVARRKRILHDPEPA